MALFVEQRVILLAVAQRGAALDAAHQLVRGVIDRQLDQGQDLLALAIGQCQFVEQGAKPGLSLAPLRI